MKGRTRPAAIWKVSILSAWVIGGCAAGTSPGGASASSDDPAVATVSVSRPASPTLSPRVEDRAGLTRAVNERLTYAMKRIEGVDQTALNKDQREMHASVLTFVAKARKALSADDLAGAQVLAEKASKLADALASARR